LFFGWLTDKLGRKKLFSITVLIYLIATMASGLSWNFASLAVFRFITGLGIGGEYAAVNATIQELIPARQRGLVGLCVNGSYWLGAALGAVGATVALDKSIIDPELGWRVAFFIGGTIGLVVLFLRRFIPESPRWLMTHGDPEDASKVTSEIEERVRRESGRDLPPPEGKTLRLHRHKGDWFLESLKVLVTTYRQRTIVGAVLMGAQAFCYNAVLFTYALMLTRFYHVPDQHVGWYMLPFALGNFAGPVTMGRLFDTIGRKRMIAATYAIAGVLLAVVGALFAMGVLTAVTQTIGWTVIFFFASAAASSAYLTVGETFPLEVRAVAISIFYAIGIAVGGVAGPAVFGALIQGSRTDLLWGYLMGAVFMLAAGIVQALLGVEAAGQSLEKVAPPLSAA
jgi:MFS family permease